MPLNKSRLIISRVVSKSSFCRAAAAASSSSSDAAAKAKLTYTERQAALGRPVSPHVTIYKFPVAAISSITNRVTGVGLFAGVSAVGAITLFGGDSPLIMKAIGQSAIGPLAKGIVAFPLVYHYLGGSYVNPSIHSFIHTYMLLCTQIDSYSSN